MHAGDAGPMGWDRERSVPLSGTRATGRPMEHVQLLNSVDTLVDGDHLGDHVGPIGVDGNHDEALAVVASLEVHLRRILVELANELDNAVQSARRREVNPQRRSRLCETTCDRSVGTSQGEEHRHHDNRPDNCNEVRPGPGGEADGGDRPQSCGRCETGDGGTVPEYRPGSEKPDPGDDLGGNAALVSAFETDDRDDGEQGSANANQRVRPQTSRLLRRLAFEPDQAAAHRGQHQPRYHLVERQGPQLPVDWLHHRTTVGTKRARK